MNRNGTSSYEPSQARLRELFTYRAGHLIRRLCAGPVPKGFSTSQIKPRPDGYTRVKVDGKNFYLHRLVWIYHNGAIPDGVEIDHKYGVRSDCRVSELRVSSFKQNSSNKGKPIGCSSKYVGVCASSHSPGKWSAYLRVDGSVKFFGTAHQTEEQAYSARVCAEKKYHGEFATHRRKGR